jgi:hypothetical protein
MLKVLDCGIQFTPVQFGDTNVVMIVRRTKYRSILLVKFLLASVKQNLRPFLNLRLLRVFGNEVIEAANGLLELF